MDLLPSEWTLVSGVGAVENDLKVAKLLAKGNE